jgi:hypothetical protein
MPVNERPIIRWYVATLIFRCLINGKDGNPYCGTDRETPEVQREVLLLQSHSPEAAYDLALERARYRGEKVYMAYTNASGETVSWEFAGLEDLVELPLRRTLDGAIVWGRSVLGLPASSLVYPKDMLSVFCEERGWFSSPADHHD